MIKKKICLIGGFAVGKTSLVQQYVKGLFSEDYLTTVGVKIDQRQEEIQGQQVLLMIWDLAGRDQFAAVKKSYLRGADGFLFVADGTRRETLEAVAEELSEISQDFPQAKARLLVNKCDLRSEWEVSEDDLRPFVELGLTVDYTSAKARTGVSEAFHALAASLIQKGGGDRDD
ncbi:Rab family GTPase [Roseibacillus ishigakijimensis]|uniref:GTP-binding protein n=1 Tax=Roseibacillus ishigakijimensis TaxID=454146 RepID=A0A934RLN9_9BACT|nr:Rab family GTPase [Roseibacillus ishigakijimensis]MBK1833123.1 GTP-binding protein [Roseibacillus ishigakijimensis]